MEGTVLLMSGGNLDCAKHHILGIKPFLIFRGSKKNMSLNLYGKLRYFESDPFDMLGKIIAHFSFDNKNSDFPLVAGLLGYLSYDLKDAIEDLPHTSIDDLSLPHIYFAAPSVLIVQKKDRGDIKIFVPEIDNNKDKVKENLNWFKSMITKKPPAKGSFKGASLGFRSDFTKKSYMGAIKKIIEYIASGHVYQVNMSQRFQMDMKGDPFALFKRLYEMNPAPFFAYVNAGDHNIISTSPERFILRNGKKIETRPIKGTRPRKKDPDEDKRMATELENSKKDDAELSMIVDLLRNDMGKVCKQGSVKVTAHKRLEAYENVYHLVSIVEGILDDDKDSKDIIKATFPGGSITGCPKIRAMEIIDELEPSRRHIYTGSIGYISFHDTMDLSIAIRVATILNGKIIFSVGGGIVYDSSPEDEYDETLHKGRSLMAVFEEKNKAPEKEPVIWINGILKPSGQTLISPLTPGFQYGFGFFETIRVVKGIPKFLDEHIKRFSKAWSYLFNTKAPDLTWNDIIRLVICENGLENDIAALKILAAKGMRDLAPFDDTLMIQAKPYVHRLKNKKDNAIRLITYPEKRLTHLADHKTMNYLYYFLAGKWAASKGYDEALILNYDGSVSETNSANIFLIKNKSVIIPKSPHVLSGVMLNGATNLLSAMGFDIIRKKIFPQDIFNNDEAFLTNSLMGVVPVLSLDGKKIGKNSDLWKKINKLIL